MSLELWRTYFEVICTRYESKEDFLIQNDLFKGKFYCSVFSDDLQSTLYMRNNPLVDEKIKSNLDGKTVANIYESYLKESRTFGSIVMDVLRESELNEFIEHRNGQ